MIYTLCTNFCNKNLTNSFFSYNKHNYFLNSRMADEKNSSNTSKLSTPPPEKKVTLSQALADANATPTSPLGKALAAKKEHDTLPETPSSPPKSVFPFLV